MKQLVLPPVRLAGQHRDLESGLHAVFGPAMLRRVHGPSLRGEAPFDAMGRRAFKFAVRVDSVPPPIRRFFCGSELGVTTRQSVDTSDPDRWTVTNRMKLHFVGAELFKLRPVFWLERAPDGVVFLGGRVRHDAVLPPPLNGIAEAFMELNTRRELLHFARCLHEGGVIDSVPLDGLLPGSGSGGRPGSQT